MGLEDEIRKEAIENVAASDLVLDLFAQADAGEISWKDAIADIQAAIDAEHDYLSSEEYLREQAELNEGDTRFAMERDGRAAG